MALYGSRLNSPAKKMFIQQLGEEEVTSTLNPTDLVWLQGILVRVDESTNEAVLDDARASTRVDFSSMKRLRCHDNLISVGSYVMVIGKVESFAPNPLIKCIKLCPISDSEIEECFWEMEVVHQQRHIFQKKREQREKELFGHFPLGY